MKFNKKFIAAGAALVLGLSAIPVSISLTRGDVAPNELSNLIVPTKPGKGETVSFLPETLREFLDLENLDTTYTDKIEKLSELMPYSAEAATWSNYISHEYNYQNARDLYKKYDISYLPTNNNLSWSSKIDAKSYRVIISQDSKFKTIEREYTVNGDKNSVTFTNPYTGTTYYWQVIATKNNNDLVYSDIFSFNVADDPRTVLIDGVSNTRDLGGRTNIDGKKMKEGLVYRGNMLETMTATGKDEFKNNLGIVSDFDLRGVGEGAANPLNLPNYYACPSPMDYVENYQGSSNIGDVSSPESNVKNFGRAIKQMAIPSNYPLYFHCAVGRDRTGWMGMCLDYLCNMSDETVLKEFLISLFSCCGCYLKGNLEFYNRFIRIRDYLRTFPGETMSEKVEYYLTTYADVTHEECENVRKILLGEIDTGFRPGVANPNNYENYAKVTFRQYGQTNIIKLVEKGSLLTEPSTDGKGNWYNGDSLWNFATDTVEDDIYLDYVEPIKNKVIIHFIGVDRDDEVLFVDDGYLLDFNAYALEGYTFKVYDENFAEVTNSVINGDKLFNIVYKNAGSYKPKPNTRIIVMAGQSNAAGVGHYPYLEKSLPEEHIKQINEGFDNVLISGYTHGKFFNGCEKVYADSESMSAGTRGTFGFEVGLADRLSKIYPDETIYIVKYGFGSSSLICDFKSPSTPFIDCGFQPVEAGQKPGWLYNGMVKSLHETIDYIKESTDSYPVIDGFMWMQGESDSSNYVATEKYPEIFENLVGDLKTEFEDYISGKFAVYDATIADSELWAASYEINGYKNDRADANNVVLNTTKRGLTTMYEPYGSVDKAHYDAGCYLDLGHYFADEYIKHVNPNYTPVKLEINSEDRIVLSKVEGDGEINVSTTFNGNPVESDIQYFSQDNKIFTVDENGVITPTGEGCTNLKIQAYYNGEITTKLVPVRVFAGRIDEVQMPSLIDENKIHYNGRNVVTDDKVTFISTLSGFETTFTGTDLIADLCTVKNAFMQGLPIKIKVYVDDNEGEEILVPNTVTPITLAHFETPGTHKVKVQKVNYEFRGYIEMTALYGPSEFLDTIDNRKKVLIYGDSITAGCGINGLGSSDTRDNEDGTLTYAAQLVNEYDLNAQVVAITGISLGAPVFRPKTTSKIYDNISYTWSYKYDMNEFVPDLIIANLGTNDAGALATQPNQYGKYTSAEDVYNGASSLLGNLRKYYSNARVIFCMGMMGYDDEVGNAINRAVSDSSDANPTFSTLQTYMKFGYSEATPTYGGHPTPECHKRAFEQLKAQRLVKEVVGF